MDISGVISALVVGVVIGALGRLVLPGRQQVGLLWTIVVGIIAAFIGTGIADGVGVADTRGFDWIELIIQIALAAVGVGALERARAGGGVRR
ncbi:GlsB/YeaQ/YmgE family stress response membrane protein [Streptomyces sp. 8N114]|uniref:GlsB/YeaQ/YmgE family stress response membrane protein n=1 Tax=Streptomyces sp. 8N114 TaxID=3457419 RepID=UPI003FD5BCC8